MSGGHPFPQGTPSVQRGPQCSEDQSANTRRALYEEIRGIIWNQKENGDHMMELRVLRYFI